MFASTAGNARHDSPVLVWTNFTYFRLGCVAFFPRGFAPKIFVF
jgi:hypothetical protein